MPKEKRSKYVYATQELLEKVNPKNKELWNKYINGKRTLSETTKYNYQSDINQLFVFILLTYDNKYILDMDTEEIADMLDDFVAMCATAFKNKDRRIARRLSSISSLFEYYKKKRKVKENPVELLERPTIQKGKYEIEQTFLTKEDVDKIRKGLEEINNTQLTLFFNLGLRTMARINALCNIRIDQINLDKKRIERVIEKEGYEVTLMFDERCKDYIIKWINERKEKGVNCPYLFITKYNGYDKVEKATIQSSWIKTIGNIIGKDLHCHDLRHSGSNLLFQSGVSLEMVSKSLNHKSTQVTQDFYLQMNLDNLQEELEKIDM